MCQMAEQNRMNFVDCQGAMYESKGPQSKKDFQRYEQTGSGSRWYVANERDLPDHKELDFDRFHFGLGIRDPIQRSMSHWNHVSGDPMNKKSRDRERLPLDFAKWCLKFEDNFITRRLCGSDCKDVPKGKITQKHVDAVKDLLQRFEVLWVLEDAYLSKRLLSSVLGWNHELLHRNKINKGSSAYESLWDGVPEELKDQIALHHWADYQIYLFSRERLRELVDLRGRYKGAYSDCQDKCCGHCSPFL